MALTLCYTGGMTSGWHRAKGKVVGVRLPDKVYAAVWVRARKRGMTVSSFVRETIEREVIRKR